MTIPRKFTILALGMFATLVAHPQSAHAVFNYNTYGFNYTQDFSSMGIVANEATTSLPTDWLGNAPGVPAFGTTAWGNNGGGTGSQGVYDLTGGFPAPSGDVAPLASAPAAGVNLGGSVLVGFQNNYGGTLSKFTLSADFVSLTAFPGGTFQLQYAVVSTPITTLGGFLGTTWSAPIWDSSVNTVGSLQSGVVATGFAWNPSQYLYVRLFNSSGGTGISGIDNFSFVAVPEPSTWIVGGLLVAFAGYSTFRRFQKPAQTLSDIRA